MGKLEESKIIRPKKQIPYSATDKPIDIVRKSPQHHSGKTKYKLPADPSNPNETEINW
jgi:hypothetical protein